MTRTDYRLNTTEMASNHLITNSFKSVKPNKNRTFKKLSNEISTKDFPTCSTSKTDPDEELKILKHFDVTLEYGPCTGITRLERWERAEKHGLNPPLVVKEILEKYPTDSEYVESLWNDYPL